MEKLRKVLIIILYVVAVLLTLCAILSLFRNAPNHYLKMLDFPRIEFFIFTVITLIAFTIVAKRRLWYNYLVIAGLLSGLIINGTFLINYTSLVPVEVPSIKKLKAADNQFSLLLTNVEMSNKTVQPLIDLIALKKPDLILAMEVNKWWDEKLSVLEKEYPYSQHTINDVTYGMILYSRFPLKKIEVDYLNNKKVPSFHGILRLKKGENISFHCIHPVPPTRFKELPDDEDQRETALKKLGNKIDDPKLPTLVVGDLNDVVWSYVDELTGTKNILYDVRVGRGFYNSYNAKNFLMRWPLDHVFVTKEFRLKKLERLPKIGSDHFPIYVELVLKNEQKN